MKRKPLIHIVKAISTAALMLCIITPSAQAKNLICEAILGQGIPREAIARGRLIEKLFNNLLNRDPEIADFTQAKSVAIRIIRKEIKPGESVPLELIHLLKSIQLTDFETKATKLVLKEWKGKFQFTPDEIAEMIEIKQILSKENRQYDILDRFEIENTIAGRTITKTTTISKNTSGLRPIVIMGRYEKYEARRFAATIADLAQRKLGVKINVADNTMAPGDHIVIAYKRGDSYYLTDATFTTLIDGKTDYMIASDHRTYERVLIPLIDPLTKEKALLFRKH